MADIEYIWPEPHNIGGLPISPGTRHGGLLFVSGHASVGDDGVIVPDTFSGEFWRTIQNIERVLHAGGSSLEHVVQVRAYVRDPALIGEYNDLYRIAFKAPYPARTTLTNCLPDTIQFEMECIAVASGSAPA